MVCINFHHHDFQVQNFLRIPKNIFHQSCLPQHNCTIHQQLPMILIFKLFQEYLLLPNLISTSLTQGQVYENMQYISNLLLFEPRSHDLFFVLVLALPFIFVYLFYLLHHLVLIIIHHFIKAHHYYLLNRHLIYVLKLLILLLILLIPQPIQLILLPIWLIPQLIQLIPLLFLYALLPLLIVFPPPIQLFFVYTHHIDFLNQFSLHHSDPSNKLIPTQSLLYCDALLQQFIQHNHHQTGQDLLYEQVPTH